MYFDDDDLFEEVKAQDYSYIWSIPNATIQESIPRTAAEIMNHKNIACSVSGGADSDIMLDIVNRLDMDIFEKNGECFDEVAKAFKNISEKLYEQRQSGYE